MQFSSIKKLKQRNIFYILSIGGSIILSLLPLFSQLYFYYDQARDGFEAYNIWHNHDLKILGPGTDIVGVYHGALWYYFLAIPYSVSNNNPLAAALFCYVLLFFSAIYVAKLATALFHTEIVTRATVILYLLSPLFQIGSRWVSNPILGFLIMPMLLYYSWIYFTKKTYLSLVLWSISLGVLIQSDFANIFFIISIMILFFVFRFIPSLQQIAIFILAFSATMATYIISEIKFHARSTQAVLSYLSHHSGTGDLIISTEKALGKMSDLLSVSIFPFPRLIIFIVLFFLAGLLIMKKKYLRHERTEVLFLLSWMSILFLFTMFNTGISNSYFVFFPFLLPTVLLFTFFLVQIISNKHIYYFIIGLIIFSQVICSLRWIQTAKNILTVQDGITFSQEKRVIDETYVEAEYKPFSLNTITNPLYINTTWAYLYRFYAYPRYHYLPEWTGKDQTGNPGIPLAQRTNPLPAHFLLIEPTAGIPDFFLAQEIQEENNRTVIVSEKRFHQFILQKRMSRNVSLEKTL